MACSLVQNVMGEEGRDKGEEISACNNTPTNGKEARDKGQHGDLLDLLDLKKVLGYHQVKRNSERG